MERVAAVLVLDLAELRPSFEKSRHRPRIQ